MLTNRPPSQVIAREAVAAMAARDRLPRRRRMPDIRLLIGAGIVAIVLAVIGIPAIATLFTLKAAGDDLKAGATRLEGKGLALTTPDTQAADADFLRAEQRFLKAEAGLRTDWAFALLSLLPAGKRQVDAAIILTHIGTRIGRAGHEGVRIADTLIAAKVVGPGARRNPGDTALAVHPDVLSWQREGTAPVAFLRKLTEVRRIVEPAAAELAAERASARELAGIEDAYRHMESALAGREVDYHAFDLADMRFHRAIMQACHNDLLEQMSGVVFGALLVSFRATSRLPGSARASLPKHRAILDAIRHRNARGASRAMRRLVHATAREIEAFSKRPSVRRARARG